ncbi:MAG: phosphoenolpyruvate synthase [Verrucomicrobia bacterium]|nr:phosphoenolpyruvate synthase [Verrucomicrobiota bacterium]MBS0637381.1 phosphoenolpyruvate synthase [Verrucomicrobiota bacterium]
MQKKRTEEFILWFDEIGINDVPLVGGKNASLGEMLQNRVLRDKIPNGFAITSYAYRYVLEKAGVLKELKKILKGLDVKNEKALEKAGAKARKLIRDCEFPPELEEAISRAYHQLSAQYNVKNLDVAVRSSATAEDLPSASFAGQQESFLNVQGVKGLLEACKNCFSSLFTNRAIVYRASNKFDHFKVFLSIGVQRMVRSDLASSGVMFTLDTETGFRDVVFITGSFGLGESVVQGAVNPDEFYVFKPTLKTGYKPLINKRLGDKASQIIYAGNGTKKIKTKKEEREKFCLSDEEVLLLAKWAVAVEEHYSKKYGKWTPMDLEWAKDGHTQELFIVQARPETVFSQKNRNIIEEYRLLQKGKVLATGKSVGNKIAHGPARIIEDAKDIKRFKAGEILVTDMTDPDWVPIMRMASAIVTNRGGRTSHAAIVSRELGLPCIVGTNNATQVIQEGKTITVSCTQGEKGVVYEGRLKYKVENIDVSRAAKPKTKVMMNVGYPDDAFELHFLPCSGVGLAREEFIVNEYIRIHPMALVNFEEVKDLKTQKQINTLCAGYKNKKQYFIDKLAMGVAIIASAFYPRDVILRFSDFKTNEYVNLIGGKYFEPKEENPMIGWRGASRYYSAGYKEGFALECAAIKKVREEFGLVNLKVMIPVCRTVEEGKKVLEVMKKNGLERGKNKLEVYVMCEIPSNVILADRFCDIFDGMSIGSNDLTQMTLGVDRDSELVSDIFDERNEAVLRMIAHVIKIAKKRKRKIGICGDAPSTYPEFAEFLVDCGIDSISLSPDALLRTSMTIAKREKKQKQKAPKSKETW